MAYRIIILNGERRGERVEIGTSPMTIGTGAEAGLRLADTDMAPVHAALVLHGETLVARAVAANATLRLNGQEHHEGPLQHGDVLQLGNTRLFIQSHTGGPAWERLTGFRQSRKWIPLALIVVALVAFLSPRGWRGRQTPPAATPAGSAVPSGAPSGAAAGESDDTVVSNMARIAIDPSIVLTSHPPEIIDAVTTLAGVASNRIDEEIHRSRLELEAATRFLEAKSEDERAADIAGQRTGAATGLREAQATMAPGTPAPVPEPQPGP